MILIALGANLPSEAGPPAKTIGAALASLKNRGVEIAAQSCLYQTTAWPDPTDPAFINAVAALRTPLQPTALMGLLHQVETSFGRKRSVPNAPRTLDIDLLDYEGRIAAADPILPHPRLQERAFVLVPLKEIAPAWRHPLSGRTAQELLDFLSNPGMVRKLTL